MLKWLPGFGPIYNFSKTLISSIPQSFHHRMDLVLAIGVFHHVNDAEALAILQTAKLALKPGGRFFSIDGCFVPSQSFVARTLLHLDRDRYVRTPPAYRSLVASVFPKAKAEIRSDLLRLPYEHIIFECSNP